MTSLSDILQVSRDSSSSSDFQTSPTPPRSGLPRSSLEDLPMEVKGLILRSLPEGSALRALIKSSPSYHASYLSQRHLILSSVLLNDIHPDCLATAFAVEEASKFLDQDYEDVRLARVALVRHYFAQRSVALTKDRLQDTDLDTLISIFKRHWRIQAVASQYSTEKLSVNPVTRETVQSYEPPSRNEIHRLYRALYHFELYCCLFVSSRLSEDGPYYEQRVGLGGSEYGASQRFLPNLNVWEAEEIACMREYFFDYYTRILQNCVEKLHQFRYSPNGAMHLVKENPFPDNPASWEAPYEDQKKEYWISLGLKFFRRLSHAHTAEAQARILFENPWRREHFLSRAVKGECRGPGRICSAHPINCDHRNLVNEGSKFGLWLNISDLGFVNHGKDYLRSWGYVIWDRQRLDAWKITEKETSQLAGSIGKLLSTS